MKKNDDDSYSFLFETGAKSTISQLEQWKTARESREKWANIPEIPVFGGLEMTVDAPYPTIIEVWLSFEIRTLLSRSGINSSFRNLVFANRLNLASKTTLIVPSFALFGKEKYDYVINWTKTESFILGGQLVLFLRNTGTTALNVTLKALVPISMPETEYNGLVDEGNALVGLIPVNLSQKITDDGWGVSPTDSGTVSVFENHPLVQTKTWTLRLIPEETVCVPFERQVVRNEADSERVFPLEFSFSTSNGNTFLNVQLVQKQFEFDEIFSTRLKVKSLMTPFLVVVETEQTPSLDAQLSWQQFSTKP